ncbi:hypothetical protein PCE1_004734 [Barthelona sp. PCE]
MSSAEQGNVVTPKRAKTLQNRLLKRRQQPRKRATGFNISSSSPSKTQNTGLTIDASYAVVKTEQQPEKHTKPEGMSDNQWERELRLYEEIDWTVKQLELGLANARAHKATAEELSEAQRLIALFTDPMTPKASKAHELYLLFDGKVRERMNQPIEPSKTKKKKKKRKRNRR